MSNPKPARYDTFAERHLGPTSDEVGQMLNSVGYGSLEELCKSCLPKSIQSNRSIDLPEALTEQQALDKLKGYAQQNQIWRSFIGLGYHDCHTPPVIQRNVLENPGWYTQYTPYQAEISQGRLEALLNFQTMVCDLTGLAVANASLLDEATAAAEALNLCFAATPKSNQSTTFFVSSEVHPQTLAVLETRAKPLGIELLVGQPQNFDFTTPIFGALLQYPTSEGAIIDYREFIASCHKHQARVVMAADILSLCLLTPPGELGADICVGSTQRFGVPLGYGGPHAAFFASKEEFKRKIPGRIVGVSRDRSGNPALRLALQTREQHIRRDKATSNICTSQVLLAIMASMYAVYHGPKRLTLIASQVHAHTQRLYQSLHAHGYKLPSKFFFDTLSVELDETTREKVLAKARKLKINLRQDVPTRLGISLDEATCEHDLEVLAECFSIKLVDEQTTLKEAAIPEKLRRQSSFLDHPVFNSHHSETKMLRYIRKLESRDLSLTRSMIPLGSCTMKLNATASLMPISWPEFAKIHPFVPDEQAKGYLKMIKELEGMLAASTGFAAVSLQPNSGAQGEYAGLLTIRAYHLANNDPQRRICLIPVSAHGTNPASAVMAGMKVVAIRCDQEGNIDLSDLAAKAKQHAKELAALMVTYPSTHGVFEESIREVCQIIHDHGGQVYLDGANLNAQLGLCYPGEYGPDVCHLNLHKTFSIPHGGGGPGVGPIAVRDHLAAYLPSHPLTRVGGDDAIGPVSAAPYGSAGILQIPWMYVTMLGGEGLTKCSQLAILNANYIAKRLSPSYDILFTGNNGLVAHECIIDLRPWKTKYRVEVEDVAKRLIDYGFHAPTMSWPVAGTLMIEPTESEDLGELDRFCEAMLSIYREVSAIDPKTQDENNLLKNAPHTAAEIMTDDWRHPYSREEAAFPLSWVKEHKFWPVVDRVDNVYGDRNLVCSCLPMEAYEQD